MHREVHIVMTKESILKNIYHSANLYLVLNVVLWWICVARCHGPDLPTSSLVGHVLSHGRCKGDIMRTISFSRALPRLPCAVPN